MVTEAPAPLNDVSQGALFYLRRTNGIKKNTTFKQQVQLLLGKTIFVEDTQDCELFLSHVNYYRFSAYYLPFLDRATEKCFDGTTFERVKQIYYFDQQHAFSYSVS